MLLHMCSSNMYVVNTYWFLGIAVDMADTALNQTDVSPMNTTEKKVLWKHMLKREGDPGTSGLVTVLNGWSGWPHSQIRADQRDRGTRHSDITGNSTGRNSKARTSGGGSLHLQLVVHDSMPRDSVWHIVDAQQQPLPTWGWGPFPVKFFMNLQDSRSWCNYSTGHVKKQRITGHEELV